MVSHGHSVYKAFCDKKSKALIGSVLSVAELGFPKDGRYECAKKQILDSLNGFFRDIQTELAQNYDIQHNNTETIHLRE